MTKRLPAPSRASKFQPRWALRRIVSACSSNVSRIPDSPPDQRSPLAREPAQQDVIQAVDADEGFGNGHAVWHGHLLRSLGEALILQLESL
jgi:hypothetical protein